MAYSLTDYSTTEVELNDGSRSYYYKKCYCSVELQGEYIIFTSHKVENNAFRQQWSIAYTDFTTPSGTAVQVYSDIKNIIESYAAQPKAYLSAYDTTTQNPDGVNVGKPFDINTQDISDRVYISGPTITVDKSSVYNIQFSIQLENSNNQDQDVDIWLQRNGGPIDWTNSIVSVPAKHGVVNGHTIAAWNFVIFIDRLDFIELYWQTSSTAVTVPTLGASGDAPQTPSIILTVVEV